MICVEGFGDRVWFEAWHEAFASDARQYPLGPSGLDGDCELIEGTTRLFRRPVRFLVAPVNAHTPRYDWKTRAGVSVEHVDRFLRETLSASRAHGIELSLVPDGGVTLNLISDLVRTGRWCAVIDDAEKSPVIDVSGDWDEYLGASPRRRKLNQQERQLRALGAVTSGEVGRGPEWREWYERALRLEASGWKGREGSAILLRANEARFYRKIAVSAADQGRLRLFVLSLGERLLAFYLGIVDGLTLFYLKTAYDEEFDRLSPGAVLFRLSLRECFGDPRIMAVAIPGGPEWTVQWSTRVERLKRVRLAPRSSLAGYLLRAESRIKRAKGWLHGFRSASPSHRGRAC
jgi:Acetyltransferase (GNAT) domain